MKKLHFLIFFCSLTFALSAQNSFLIYSMKGTVTVKENNISSPAKVGKPLNNTASVKVSPGGAVTLICNEAAMFTITKAGNYELSKFGDSCRISTNSASANYVKYVWASMTKSSGSAGSNRKAYMNTVGASTRGDINNIWIDYRLDTVNYSGIKGDFPLSWKSYAEAKDFEFSLYSSDNISTPILTAFVTKLKIPIVDFSSKIKPGNSYYWTAAIKGEENDILKIFNYVTPEKYAAVLQSIKQQGAAAFEAPAEKAYRFAFMLEDAHYLAEAYDYYLKAAALDTNNILYRNTLMSFRKDYEIK